MSWGRRDSRGRPPAGLDRAQSSFRTTRPRQAQRGEPGGADDRHDVAPASVRRTRTRRPPGRARVRSRDEAALEETRARRRGPTQPPGPGRGPSLRRRVRAGPGSGRAAAAVGGRRVGGADEGDGGGAVDPVRGRPGTMLDLDHGTYPYVTSSNATVGARARDSASDRVRSTPCSASRRLTRRASAKARFRRNSTAQKARRFAGKGHEFGAVTGRPRRCGWFDAVQVRHAVRVNGLDAVVITKMDVLDGLSAVPICTGYRIGDEVCEEFPADLRGCSGARPWWKRCQAGPRPRPARRDSAASRPRRGPTWNASSS